MKETAVNKIPYPEDSDVPNAPAQIKALADLLDTLKWGSRNLKPTIGIVPMTEAKSLSKGIGEWQDLPAKLEITPAVASILRVTLVAQSAIGGEGSGTGIAEVSFSVDGGAELTPSAIIRLESSEERLLNSGSMVYDIALTAAKHTIQMRGRNNGGLWKPVISTATRFSYELIAS